MSPNEQCHFELALIKVRRIQNRWSGCVPGVAARQRVPAPKQDQGPAQPLPGTRWAMDTGTARPAGAEGSGCEQRAPNPRGAAGREGGLAGAAG